MRGLAAIMLAVGIVGCVFGLMVARLSPTAFFTAIGFGLSGMVAVILIWAIWTLRRTKG